MAMVAIEVRELRETIIALKLQRAQKPSPTLNDMKIKYTWNHIRQDVAKAVKEGWKARKSMWLAYAGIAPENNPEEQSKANKA